MDFRASAPALLGALLIGAGAPAAAETLAGLCPDGSAFVVQDRAAVPCRYARFVEPEDMPPLRPKFLPRPYAWQLDREARDPDNPYNLVERARKIRELRTRRSGPSGPSLVGSGASAANPPGGSSVIPRTASGAANGRVDRVFGLALREPELADLLELVELRQQLAPARIEVEDAAGAARLQISFAYSAAFEARALEALGLSDGRRVLVFSLYALQPTEFHPNFFVIQREITFWPEPEDPREVGLLAGERGAVPAGGVVLGYLVVPDRFDLAGAIEFFWNDHHARAQLVP